MRREVWVGGDTLLVDGQRQRYVRNSRHEAARASKILTAATGRELEVRAILVIVGADEIKVKEPPADVAVLTRWKLVRWLRRKPECPDADVVEAVYEAARRSTTWSTPHPWSSERPSTRT